MEKMYLVSSSEDNNPEKCWPIAAFDSLENAMKHKTECDEYDELNYHHVLELLINPTIKR
jgi:hypothetical protein